MSSDEVKRLTELNTRLESENAAMKLDLYFKDGRLETLRSYLWDRGNELAEAQSQLSWYQEQMKTLEQTIHRNQRTIQGKNRLNLIIKLVWSYSTKNKFEIKFRNEKTDELTPIATLLNGHNFN